LLRLRELSVLFLIRTVAIASPIVVGPDKLQQTLCVVPKCCLIFRGRGVEAPLGNREDAMQPGALVRPVTLSLAFVHTFPARTHVMAFLENRSLGDGWKGLGALFAIGFYLLPVGVQARALARAWHNRRLVLRAAAWLLVAVHAVPALDHLPLFARSGAWGDAWRGLGSLFAIGWFLTPLSLQARAIVVLKRGFLSVAVGAVE
jgi:hypothetical protein